MLRRKVVSLDSVTLGYRRRGLFTKSKYHPVLDNICLDIHAGETLGVIGRNGAGKSSLLKLIAGIIAPESGSIERFDHQIVLLSYQLGFNKNLTGRENAIHSALLQGVSRHEIESRMDDIIAFSDLEEAIDDPLATYSTGMKARLGFSVAIQLNSDIILVDEALGVGDHSFRKKSAAFMKSWMSSDKTVVFVSHDESTIKSLCENVVWLEGGRVVAKGPSHEILDYYYKYDDVVSSLALSLGMTEADVRAHENNRNPLQVINRLQTELTALWSAEDAAGKEGGIVRYCRPKKNQILSALVEEENGFYSWVEDTRLILTDTESTVRAAYNAFTGLVSSLSGELKLSEQEFRNSGHYTRLFSMLDLLSGGDRVV